MIEEPFTDAERLLLMRLAIEEQLRRPSDDLVALISRLSGVDTRIVAYRAYPSRFPPAS